MRTRFPQLHLGLKTKSVLTISFLILVTSIILSVFLIERQSSMIQMELEKRGKSMVRNLAHNAEYGVLVENKPLLLNLMEGLYQEEEVVYINIRDRRGNILAEWERSGEFHQVHSKFRPDDAPPSSTLPSKEYYVVSGQEFYDFSYPIKTTRVERSKEEVGLLLEDKNAAVTRKKQIGLAEIGMSLQNMRREISDMKRIVVLLTALVVAVGVVLAIFLVNIVIKPVKKLVQATEKVASGDLSQVVKVTTKDEIGTLASSFNRMTTSLKESREKIEEYNRTLEGKVKERTAELEKTNRELEKTNRELENALKSLKDTQVQLIQMEKMAAVGQLAAGVAHELNNPLGGILGYSQFALEKIDQKQLSEFTPEDTATFLLYLRDIEQQTKRCRSIIQSLLKFSRASRKEEFEPIAVSLVLEETLKFTRHQIQKSKVNLTQELAESLPQINGNSGQLQQVFTNLILNAAQAMPDGGSLTVASGIGEDAKTVQISFTDTGVGISEKNLDKIFEPFFTSKKVGEGTGLGLSVSYGLIKNHSGEIKVSSRMGQGTTFMVILPVAGGEVAGGVKDEKELAIGG
ncbi:MAG: ATP-binding protein [Candidatus Zixiibacteriota bacterium]